MKARVGTSLEEVDPAFMHSILPLVDVVEVIPDSLAIKAEDGHSFISKQTLDVLAEIAKNATIILHGVGLSIGSFQGWNDPYFRLLDQILDAVPVAWHSEHLGFTHVDGHFTGTMLSLPRTQEAFDLVAGRTQRIMERYPLPFLLENIVNLLPDPPAQMSEAAFLNQLTMDTGCEILLDVYNLRCNAHNQGFALAEFLTEIDLSRVREIHVAGGVEHAGLMLDIHSRSTQDETRKLLVDVLLRSPNASAVIYEIMPQAVPALGYPSWTDELHFLRSVVAA